MWGIIIVVGAAMLILGGALTMAMCRAAKIADQDSCRELLEYLQKKERNNPAGTSVE